MKMTSVLRDQLRQLLLVACCLWMVGTTAALAETYPLSDVVPDGVSAEHQETLQSQTQQFADAMFHHLLLRLDEITRVCELSDAQQRMMTVAAKGAVQHRLDEWLGVMMDTFIVDGERDERIQGGPQIFQQGGGWVDARRAVIDGNEIVRINVITVRNNLQQIRIAGATHMKDVILHALGPNPNVSVVDQESGQRLLKSPHLDVANHLVWTATLERTLTGEQKEQLAEAKAEREALPREWRHERVMFAIDSFLLLDRSQRGPLTERVSEFLDMPQIKRWIERRPGIDDEKLATMAFRSISAEDVEDSLSQWQLAEWRRLAPDKK